MTDFLDRYLAAISRELPAAQRNDIVAELRDDLLSRIEIKEEALGRPLERDEVEAVLIDFGHPLVVAGRYRAVQHLVGPAVFPFWWVGLKVTLGVIAAIYVVAAIVAFAFAPGDMPHRDLPDLVPTLVTAFGAVTLVAVFLERFDMMKHLYRWRPQQLPPAGVKTPSIFERVVEMGMQVAFILWWTHVISFRDWIPMGAVSPRLGQVFAEWFWPILAYSGFELAVNALALVRPGWVRVNAGLTVLRSLAVTAIVAGLLQAGHWVDITSTMLDADRLEVVQTNFDLGLKIGLVVTLACMAIKVALDAYRFWRVTQETRTPFTAKAA